MSYPLLSKRILTKIRIAYEDFLLYKSFIRDFSKYEQWLKDYLELDDKDKENIIKKFERSQTATIIYGMSKKDTEIFINQLGCFYIKPTTIAFYSALDRMTKGKDKDEYDFEEVKQSALEESRALYIRRANMKKYAKDSKNISFKIQSYT